MNLLRSIFFLSALLFANITIGQNGISIQSWVDKNSIYLGEQIQLTIEMKVPGEPAISSFKLDSINHFEILEPPIIDTSTEGGNTVIKAVYRITSFDSGRWVIPSYFLPGGARSDSIRVDVVFSEFDPNQPYHDIKDILEVGATKKKTAWWWYAAGGAVLLALLLLYVLRKKKPLPVAVAKVSIDPYDEALKQLEQLEMDKPGPKLYHTRLADIFRLYIFRKKGILSLQKTTDDLVVQLKSLHLNKEQFDRLSQSLRLSDLVKFAKYIPSDEDTKNCLTEIKNAIITIEKQEAKAPL